MYTLAIDLWVFFRKNTRKIENQLKGLHLKVILHFVPAMLAVDYILNLHSFSFSFCHLGAEAQNPI